MAHADYSFYTDVFHGDKLTAETADKWLDRASDGVGFGIRILMPRRAV